jgi:hypothetical protein
VNGLTTIWIDSSWGSVDPGTVAIAAGALVSTATVLALKAVPRAAKKTSHIQ